MTLFNLLQRVFSTRAIAFALVVFGPVAAGAATLRVSISGSDTAGCGTEVTPCASIQYAVNLANSGDTILVAQGTYIDNQNCLGSVETAVVCVMLKDLTIFGGFDGSDWSVQNPAANVTVIDGQNSRRGIISGKTFPGDPQFTRLRLEGFTIRNGRAEQESGEAATYEFGGGLRTKFGHLTLRDMVFDQNTAEAPAGHFAGGGALAVQSNSDNLLDVTLERVQFTNNQATGGGGAGDVGATLGGALEIDHATLIRAFDLRFENNTASAPPSGGRSLGGGAHFTFGTSGVLEKIVATGNVAVGTDTFGGALFVEGDPDPSSLDKTQITVLDGDFRNNISRGSGLAVGGAIMGINSSLALERVAVIGNIAEGNPSGSNAFSAAGGGVYLEATVSGEDPVFGIDNSIFAKNTTKGTQGGGGGLFLLGADATVSHTTVAQNQQTGTNGFGNGICVNTRPGSPGRSSTITLNFSLVTGHTQFSNGDAVFLNGNGPLAPAGIFNRNLFAGNTRDICPYDPTFCAGSKTLLNNIFAGAAVPIFYVDPAGSDYHIISGSPPHPADEATGSTETIDFDGAARDATPDIGADELGALAHRLTIRKLGNGTGTVASSPPGIGCGADCTEIYANATVVALATTPDPGFYFGGFGGDPDCADGNVTMDTDRQCDATFTDSPGICSVGPPDDLVLPSQTVNTTKTEQACSSISVGSGFSGSGPYTVGPSGSVTFESLQVILGNDFTVQGDFTVLLNLP